MGVDAHGVGAGRSWDWDARYTKLGEVEDCAFSGIEVPSDVRQASAQRVRKSRYERNIFSLKMADSVLGVAWFYLLRISLYTYVQ